MNASVSVVPIDTVAVQSNPLILDYLPNIPLEEKGCPRRTCLRIDLILLAIEALEIGGSEALLDVSRELELQDIIRNRVNLWRLRSTNPLRRAHTRRPLTLVEAKALVVIACHVAKRLTVLLRQLLLAEQQMSDKQIPLEQNLRLSHYLERFRAHFRSRMNPRRSGVLAYNSDDKLNELALNLLAQLLFCTGTAGTQRFWMSLFDGEIE
jgi:hypothetical protein